MFFCLFCLIIFVSIKANNPKQKSMRMFVRLFLIATVLFFGETLAYIFRGNLGLFNILVTRIANLMVFAMNIAMANTYVRFVSSVFVEKGAEVSGNSVKIANIFSCINIFIVVVNLFYPWMYYFDEANYYHRNNSWYVYTLISLVVIFIGAGMAIILANIFFSLAFEYFPFVFYLAPYYEYVASCLSNSASLRVKYGFANGD